MLSPKAIEVAVAAFKNKSKKLRGLKATKARTPAAMIRAIATKDAETAKLKALVKSGAVSMPTLKQP